MSTSNSETFARSSTKEESNEISTTAGSEHECEPGRFCIGKIVVQQAKLSIPYEIRLRNNVTSDECIEKGTFKKVQSFGANTVFEDLTKEQYEKRKAEGKDPMIK